MDLLDRERRLTCSIDFFFGNANTVLSGCDNDNRDRCDGENEVAGLDLHFMVHDTKRTLHYVGAIAHTRWTPKTRYRSAAPQIFRLGELVAIRRGQHGIASAT